MSQPFYLPDLGEGVHEAEILAIAVSVGQQVVEGDVILEIETDKAAVEIPSPFTGSVESISVAIGDIPKVGDLLLSFIVKDDISSPKQTDSSPQTKPSAGKPTHATGPVPASPSTRRLARELGVDLHEVTPTGAGGVVTKEDLESFATQKKNPPPEIISSPPESPQPEQKQEVKISSADLAGFCKWGEVEKIPFRSIRRATAKQMSQSWNRIPHVHCQDKIDITKLEEFRQNHKDDIEQAGGKLTITIFAMKAVATALKHYPYFNSSLDEPNQQIILKHFFNIGIAVDTENGLLVPVFRDVDRKSIKELAIEVNGGLQRARTGNHGRDEMQGGTFTISNAGALGGNEFSAIINHPEVAILGLGQARMQPWVVKDQRGRDEIVPRLIMPIVLCFDHRVVDGADAIRFLNIIIETLQDPEELLMTMI